MTFRLAVLLIAALCTAALPSGAQVRTGGSSAQVPFSISLAPGVSIAEAVADGRETDVNMSFTIIGGTITRLQGMHYGGLWQRYTEQVNGISSGSAVIINNGELHGIQSTYIVNLNRGLVSGMQAAGIVNRANGAVRGLQLAGIANGARTDVRGMQVSGIVNHADGPFSGAQIAGIVNYGPDRFTGFQWSGIVNLTDEAFTGFQWSGIVNTTGDFSGFQWAGIVNRAASLETGLQMGGIVNIATTAGSETIQIAPVNISMHNEGIPIGPVSYVRDHGSGLDLWIDETAFVTTGFRTGNDRVYNIISVGAQMGDPSRWATGWIFGSAVPLGSRTCLAIDAGIRHINEEGDLWTSGLNNQVTFRLIACHDITDRIAISAGPTLNYFRSRIHDGEDLASWEVFEETRGDVHHRVWPGFVCGLTFR